MPTNTLQSHRVLLVGGPAMAFTCVNCEIPLTSDSQAITNRAFADLDGKPWVDYYCYTCASKLGAKL